MADDASSPPLHDPRVGVHRFSDRMAGRPVDDVLRREVTEHLAAALTGWLQRFSNFSSWSNDLIARAAARLDLPREAVLKQTGYDLLNVVDQLIDLSITELKHAGYLEPVRTREALEELRTILADHRSLYTLGHVERESELGLITRVDPGVQDALSHVVGHDTGAAGRHLAAAWAALHQLHPDPDTAYREAVRTIEAALGPIVLPSAHGPTLGQIKNALLNDSSWTSVLDRTGPPGKPPAITEAANSSVVFLVDLLERIYGTQARHGNSEEHRTQTEAQAAAAVYAAVAVLGWTQSETLIRSPSS